MVLTLRAMLDVSRWDRDGLSQRLENCKTFMYWCSDRSMSLSFDCDHSPFPRPKFTLDMGFVGQVTVILAKT